MNEHGMKALDALTGLSISFSLGETRTVASRPASWTHGSVAESYDVVPVRLDSGDHYTVFEINADLSQEQATDAIATLASEHVAGWVRKAMQEGPKREG